MRKRWTQDRKVKGHLYKIPRGEKDIQQIYIYFIATSLILKKCKLKQCYLFHLKLAGKEHVGMRDYQGNFGDDAYVHHPDCGDGFISVHMSKFIILYT